MSKNDINTDLFDIFGRPVIGDPEYHKLYELQSHIGAVHEEPLSLTQLLDGVRLLVTRNENKSKHIIELMASELRWKREMMAWESFAAIAANDVIDIADDRAATDGG